MGLWFFLSVVVGGNFLFKAYKLHHLRIRNQEDVKRLEQTSLELSALKKLNSAREERIAQLEEAVFFGDFDLKRQFSKLEKAQAEQSTRSNPPNAIP